MEKRTIESVYSSLDIQDILAICMIHNLPGVRESYSLTRASGRWFFELYIWESVKKLVALGVFEVNLNKVSLTELGHALYKNYKNSFKLKLENHYIQYLENLSYIFKPEM